MAERTGGYDHEEVEKRRRRAVTIERNNTKEGEVLGQESVERVLSVLSRSDWFPWIEKVYAEEDRLGDDDWLRQTDAYVDVLPEATHAWRMPDQFRISVKSSWFKIDESLRARGCKKVLYLTDRQWRELNLVLLLGQMEDRAIAVSFLLQVANHLGFLADEHKWWGFVDQQPESLRTEVLQFMAKGLDRDWERLLYWVKGKTVVRAGSSLVHFI